MYKFVQIFVFCVLLLQIAWAKCDCQPSSDAKVLLGNSTYAFQGKVVDITTNWMSGGWKISFQIEKSWKKKTDKLLVINAPWEKDCGLNFQLGQHYLVFTNKKFNAKTDICLGTRPLDSLAIEQTTQLGESFEPYSQPPYTFTMIWITSGFLILSFIFMGYVVLRKRKK